MSIRRCLVPDAHVRSFVIVEAYNPLEFPLASLVRGDGHSVEPFRLQYAISPLCDGILQRVAALCHANLRAAALKDSHIHLAAILAATVRVGY